MSSRNSSTPNDDAQSEGNGADVRARATSVYEAASRYAANGSLAMLAGGALVVRAFRSNGRWRSVLQGVGGLALLGYGVRQRTASGPQRHRTGPGETDVSADAHAARYGEAGRGASSGATQTDEGPGPAGESGPEDHQGDVEFTEDPEDAAPSPHMEGDAPEDPRLDDDDDRDVEVDVSDRAMADEASEAVGPDPAQAQPVQTDETEPEVSPPEDESHVEADEPGSDPGSEDDVGSTDSGSDLDADGSDGDEVETDESD